MTLKQSFIEAKDVAKLQIRSFIYVLLTVAMFFTLKLTVPHGFLTWALCLIPCAFILVTALARVNDIGVERLGIRWQVRRLGLIMSGIAVVLIALAPFEDAWSAPTWRVTMLLYGVMFTWLTTEGMPPWWHYITGEYKKPGFDHRANLLGKRTRRGDHQGN